MAGFNVCAAAAGRKAYDYGGWMNERCKRGRYTPLFWDLGRKLPLLEYATLCHLVALGRAATRRDGWFACSGEYLVGFGLTFDEQKEVIRSLRKRGLVGRQVVEGRRLLRVNLGAVDRLLGGIN
jgi:hypothetical protein